MSCMMSAGLTLAAPSPNSVMCDHAHISTERITEEECPYIDTQVAAPKQRKVKTLSVALQVAPTSLEIRKARRLANRTRSSIACFSCRKSRTKCNEFRPCARCQKIGLTESCAVNDQVRKIQSISCDNTFNLM